MVSGLTQELLWDWDSKLHTEMGIIMGYYMPNALTITANSYAVGAHSQFLYAP